MSPCGHSGEKIVVSKLSNEERKLICEIAKGQSSPHGWAELSKEKYSRAKLLPFELVEHAPAEAEGGRARLTSEGEVVLKAMNWL